MSVRAELDYLRSKIKDLENENERFKKRDLELTYLQSLRGHVIDSKGRSFTIPGIRKPYVHCSGKYHDEKGHWVPIFYVKSTKLNLITKQWEDGNSFSFRDVCTLKILLEKAIDWALIAGEQKKMTQSKLEAMPIETLKHVSDHPNILAPLIIENEGGEDEHRNMAGTEGDSTAIGFRPAPGEERERVQFGAYESGHGDTSGDGDAGGNERTDSPPKPVRRTDSSYARQVAQLRNRDRKRR